ncbi:hypothetical protein JD501_06915 [Aeromonas hydrophila]|uniref:hypothetical protein n=1 Tax=Aeromonas hydrophila TaxID=644 RepID=UPI00191DC7AB|nr:hypothetical protein [Aeromonas hydrophila]MBL0432963.1 hypothetical protein [Aeromonas hydrophila]MBL0468912.1 hypothetical protein [Aeromonas hydrophila]
MNEEIKSLCKALDSLGEAVQNGWSDNRTLNEAFGWHHPVLDRKELAYLPISLADKIRSVKLETDDEKFLQIIDGIPEKLERLKSSTLPYFYNGNGHQAIPAYIDTLNWISSIVEPYISWVVSNDPNSMPPAISRRLKGLQAKIQQIDVDQDRLYKQIKLINEATEAAESLPSDLEDLKAARKKVESIGQDVLKISSRVSMAKEEVEGLLTLITENKLTSDQLVSNCEDAYRITTSKGLAGAFDQRAKQLAKSMWVWVFGLLCALGAAWYVGAQRIEILTSSLSTPDPKWGMVSMHFMLAVVSLGAPLWFAWLSTKQIGQRFKLAEDYGFKASVAKAYEGYRKEASRIDQKLEARLFESALTRVEEAPLRLVEGTSHGTPWHELAESSGFRDALRNIPEFRDKVFSLAQSMVDKPRRSQSKDESNTA